MNKFLVFFAILFLVAFPVFATDYYVAKTGNDTLHNGLAAAPGVDPVGPFLTVAKATTVMVAGDTVYVRTGTYNERVFLTTGNSGTSGSRITYKNYTGESPVMDGDGLGWGGCFMSGLNCTPASVVHYITIDGFEIINCPEMGIEFARNQSTRAGSVGSHGITIQNCYLHANGYDGIYMEGGDVATGGEGYGHLITHNVSSQNGSHGIKLQGDYPGDVIDRLQIRDCEISWNTCEHSTGGSENQAQGIHVSTGNHDILIAHNATHGNFCAGISIEESWNNIIEFNTSDGNGTSDHDKQGIVVWHGKNNIIRYNYCHDNPWAGIEIASDMTVAGANHVYYNILVHNGTDTTATYNGGIVVQADTPQNVYNNVLYNNHIAGIFSINAIDQNIKNNIIYSVGAGRAGDYLIQIVTTAGWTANKINHNCYYTTDLTNPWRWGSNYYTTFATWKEGSNMDTNGLNDDPAFVTPGTNFYLQPTSPCVNAGIDVGLTPDYAGISVPQGSGVDIGAYEYLGAAISVGAGAKIVIEAGGKVVIK